MTCETCGKLHEVSPLLVDGQPASPAWVEVLVAMMCRHGALGIPAEDDGAPDLGPPVPGTDTKQKRRPVF